MNIEWALVFFTLFTGLSVGIFAGITATEWLRQVATIRLRGAIASLVVLALAGIFSILHLGHPERIFGALGHPTSGIFTEALLIGLFGLGTLAYIVALRRGATDQTRKNIATASMVPGTLLAFAVGYTYVLPSRPAWDTLLLPLAYVVSAAVFGCFTLNVLATKFGANEVATKINRVSLNLLVVQAVVFALYLLRLAIAPYPDISRSLSRVLIGNLAPMFWIGLVLIGFLLPGYLVSKASKQNANKFTQLTSAKLGLVCVLVAGVVFRVMMFALGSGVRQFFDAPRS